MELHNICQIVLDIIIFLMQYLTIINAYNGNRLDNLLINIVPFILSIMHLLVYEKKCYKYIWINICNYFIGSINNTVWYIFGFSSSYRERFYDSYMLLSFIYYIQLLIEIIYTLKKLKENKTKEENENKDEIT